MDALPNDIFDLRRRKRIFCTNSTARRICGRPAPHALRAYPRGKAAGAVRADATALQHPGNRTFTGYSALCTAAGWKRTACRHGGGGRRLRSSSPHFPPQPARTKNPSAYRFGTRYRPDTRIYVRPRIHRWRQARIPDHYRMLMGDGEAKRWCTAD